MQKSPVWIVPLTILCFLPGLLAQHNSRRDGRAGAPPPRQLEKIDEAAVERGKKEFVELCGFCHGNDATGSRAPDLIRSPLVVRDEHGEAIGPVIRNGRPQRGMPAFPNANIGDIVAFLHAQVHAALHSAHVPNDYPLEKLLTGNASSGKDYFESRCSSCHSPTGDLKGIAGKYSPIDLQSRFLYPSGPSRTAKVTTAAGEQVGGTVTHLDEFSITVRDAAGWTHTYARDEVKAEVTNPLEGHRKLLFEYTDKNVHDLFAYLETLK